MPTRRSPRGAATAAKIHSAVGEVDGVLRARVPAVAVERANGLYFPTSSSATARARARSARRPERPSARSSVNEPILPCTQSAKPGVNDHDAAARRRVAELGRRRTIPTMCSRVRVVAREVSGRARPDRASALMVSMDMPTVRPVCMAANASPIVTRRATRIPQPPYDEARSSTTVPQLPSSAAAARRSGVVSAVIRRAITTTRLTACARLAN